VEQPAGSPLADGTSTVDFGNANVGATTTRTFTIRNDGVADLSGLAVTIDGANPGDFLVGSVGATTLASGTSTGFTVTFAPVTAGTRAASLHIASNDPDENPFDVALTGSRSTTLAPTSTSQRHSR